MDGVEFGITWNGICEPILFPQITIHTSSVTTLAWLGSSSTWESIAEHHIYIPIRMLSFRIHTQAQLKSNQSTYSTYLLLGGGRTPENSAKLRDLREKLHGSRKNTWNSPQAAIQNQEWSWSCEVASYPLSHHPSHGSPQMAKWHFQGNLFILGRFQKFVFISAWKHCYIMARLIRITRI